MDAINKAKAEQSETWKLALEKSFAIADKAVSGAGALATKAADTAFGVLGDVGEGAGDLLKGGGKALQGAGEGLGTGIKILAGAVGVAAIVGVVVYLKKA